MGDKRDKHLVYNEIAINNILQKGYYCLKLISRNLQVLIPINFSVDGVLMQPFIIKISHCNVTDYALQRTQ